MFSNGFLLGLAPWCSIYFHITNFLCASDVTFFFQKWQVALFFWRGSSDQFSLKTIEHSLKFQRPMTDPNGAARKMVLHGSHQQKPQSC